MVLSRHRVESVTSGKCRDTSEVAESKLGMQFVVQGQDECVCVCEAYAQSRTSTWMGVMLTGGTRW
jgi:hypothetical protein